MPLTITEYELAPEGIYRAVCAEVIFTQQEQKDPKTGQVSMADKLILCFEIDEKMQNGKRFVVEADFFANISPGNACGKFFQSWGGGGDKLTKEKIQEIAAAVDQGKVVGANGQVFIVHSTTKRGNTWVKIDKIMPAPKNGEVMSVSADYVSWKERQERRAARRDSNPLPSGLATPKEKGDVPF